MIRHHGADRGKSSTVTWRKQLPDGPGCATRVPVYHTFMELKPHNIMIERLRPLPVQKSDEVWEVAVVQLPTLVQEEGDPRPWEPLCAVCVSSEGGASASTPVRPDQLTRSCALEAITSMAQESLAPGGEPIGYLPQRVHIATMPEMVRDHLTEALQSLGVAVEIKSSLPRVTEFIRGLADTLENESDEPLKMPALHRVKGMTAESIRRFAEAAAEFWNAAPWRHFDGEVFWEIAPTPKTRALRTCFVMGGGGEEFGIGFLTSATEAQAMAIRSALGNAPGRPRGTVWSVTFDAIDIAPLPDLEYWDQHDLPIAAENGFPLPAGFTEAGRVKRPTPVQLQLMEALLRGFASIGAADAGREALSFKSTTADGPMPLTLTRTLNLGG